MDRREQLKFVLLVMSMTSCMAYSYGMIKLPTFTPFRWTKTKHTQELPKDNRCDGGTGSKQHKASVSHIPKTDKVERDLLRNKEPQ